jgi:hypothetical protein
MVGVAVGIGVVDGCGDGGGTSRTDPGVPSRTDAHTVGCNCYR